MHVNYSIPTLCGKLPLLAISLVTFDNFKVHVHCVHVVTEFYFLYTFVHVLVYMYMYVYICVYMYEWIVYTLYMSV